MQWVQSTPDLGGCSPGPLGVTSSCCNRGAVPQWECQGVEGRGTMRWISCKVQWDQHFKRLAERAEVAQECCVLAQWSLCSGAVTSLWPPHCQVFARWVGTPNGRKLQLMCSFSWQIWERVVSSCTHTYGMSVLLKGACPYFQQQYVAVTAL